MLICPFNTTVILLQISFIGSVSSGQAGLNNPCGRLLLYPCTHQKQHAARETNMLTVKHFVLFVFPSLLIYILSYENEGHFGKRNEMNETLALLRSIGSNKLPYECRTWMRGWSATRESGRMENDQSLQAMTSAHDFYSFAFFSVFIFVEQNIYQQVGDYSHGHFV